MASGLAFSLMSICVKSTSKELRPCKKDSNELIVFSVFALEISAVYRNSNVASLDLIILVFCRRNQYFTSPI